jgi:ribosomal protein S18 acetylase RimI-like enzyme
MSDEQAYEVTSLHQLAEEQAEQARALRDLCNSADGLDLKLGISAGFEAQSAEPNAFLCTLDGALVGFCTLVGGDDSQLELCGMVHPEYRRRGIGRALLHAALDSARRRPAAMRVLLICEDASVSGRAFVAAAGGKHDFSENRMETTSTPPAHGSASQLDVREARVDEAHDLAHVIGGSFGQSDDHMAEDIVRDMTAEDERYFLARLGNEPVGAFKIFIDRPKAYIYAFGVLPEYRRRGYGREILENILPRLFAEGWKAVGLEVDADNAPAQALYLAVGFHNVTVYGYYALDITSP